MDFAPLTELEAVNLMLAGIGEAPVLSLPATGEAFIAQTILHNASRALQQRGWHFNCESDFPLPGYPGGGTIQVPSNTLKIDVTSTTDDVIQRGQSLYNKTTHSGVFPDGGVKVEITLFLEFTEIPQSARNYICVKAARDFSKKVLGSDTLASLTAQDELEAKAAFLEAEADTGDYSIFDSPATARVLQRSFR